VTHPSANVSLANTWSVDHVRWTKPLAGVVATSFPSSQTAPTGSHRMFVAEGRSASNLFIDVTPSWSITGAGNVVATPITRSAYAVVTMDQPAGW